MFRNFQVPDYSIIERSCNILTLLFVHSDSLARELLTVISTGHTSLASNGVGPFTSQQILPFLLASAGKAIRLQNGYAIVTAILRLLAVAITDCDRAVRQVLENPSNLFVLDLATSASDGAGVPMIVQTVACFFLGIAFLSIKDVATATTENSLTQRSFLLMIDGRIGLTRFSDILKRPLVLTPASAAVQTELFLSPSFKTFYESKIDLIRRSLFDYYASSGSSTENSEKTPEQQIIDLQKNHISELESELEILKSQKKNEPIQVDDSRVFALEKELKSGEGKILALHNILAEKEAALESMLQSEAAILVEAEALRARADSAEVQLDELKQRESKLILSSTGESFSENESALSEKVMKLQEENETLKKEVAQKNKKIVNLEESLRSPMGFESLRESRINELEQETEALRVQLADSESTVKAITLAANAKLDNVDELTTERVDFFNIVDSSFNRISSVAHNLAEITSIEALDCMISLKGLPVNLDSPSSYALKASVFSEKMDILNTLLQEIVNSTKLLAGTCSDMTECAGFDSGSFIQPEGTAYRIRECANMLASRLREALDDLGELERYRSELEISDAQRSSLQDEVYRLTDLIASLQQNISAPDTTSAIDIYEELAAEKATNLAKEAEIDGLKLVISNLQSHDHLVAMANSSIDNREYVIQSLRQELTVANSELADANCQLSEKAQELFGVLNELNEIKDKQSDLVNTKDFEINRLQQALISAENQCKELETSYNEQDEVIAGLEADSKAKDEQIKMIVDNALQALKLELSEKEVKVVELNSLIEKFFSEKKTLEEQLSTIKAIAAGLEKELEEVKTNLSTTLANYEDHKDLSVSVLAMDASAARAESSEMARLSQELSRAESAVRSKDKELLAALQESSAAAGKISGLQIALRDLNEELEAVRKENMSLEKRLTSERGTHDLLKREADDVNEAIRKSSEEGKNKDKVILTLRQELVLVSEELKDSNRELLEKTRDLFETQNLNSQHVDDIADFASWFHDILLSSVLDDANLRESTMSSFNQLILKKKATDGNPVLEIISLTKESVKGSILSLESKVEESRESLKLKERELVQVKEKLEKAFADMKRQVLQ
jgi:chromosome segregation ATPase